MLVISYNHRYIMTFFIFTLYLIQKKDFYDFHLSNLLRLKTQILICSENENLEIELEW